MLDYLGASVSGAGDVNSDGYDDVIVGAPESDVGGSDAGQSYVYSGQTGELLWTFTGEADGDEFGSSVSGAGDVDDDGYDDLIVGAPQSDSGGSDAGRAYLYSGQSGILLFTFTGDAAGDHLGYSVSDAGDVDNDGDGDMIVGAPYNDAGGTDAGRAYVWSPCFPPPCAFCGEGSYDNFGRSVSGAGDVNNDGYADLIVGAPTHDATAQNAGRAYVYSGEDTTLLWIFTGTLSDYLGVSVSGAGDVDNDGYDDLIVGELLGGESGDGGASIYSGQTGLDWRLENHTGGWFGYSVSGAGDVNNDGYADVVVGAPIADSGDMQNTGRAFIYSGYDHNPYWMLYGWEPDQMFGVSVSGAGDVDNDGYDDVIVGALFDESPNPAARGQATVYSCQGDSVIWIFEGEALADSFGFSVTEAGDVNEDGYADLLVGAPAAGPDYAGRAYLFSGQTGALMKTFTGEATNDCYGYAVSYAGDVNNDGYGDLIVGAPLNDAAGSNAGRAYVYCGRHAYLLCTFTGEVEHDWFGWTVSGAGDVDDDGYDEVIVGAPGRNRECYGNDVGKAYLLDCEEASPIAGDANGDEEVNVGDVVYVVSYLYKSGPAPDPIWVGDCNCDEIVNVGDIVYLVSYLYKGGPPPGCP
jgi:hypothetical protein